MKTIIILALIFIIAPTGGFVAASIYKDRSDRVVETQKASTDELLTAVKSVDDRVQKITSTKNIEEWWYIVTVEMKDQDDEDPYKLTSVLYKFNSSSEVGVLISPGDALPGVNISSGEGVPYEVIDILNESLL